MSFASCVSRTESLKRTRTSLPDVQHSFRLQNASVGAAPVAISRRSRILETTRHSLIVDPGAIGTLDVRASVVAAFSGGIRRQLREPTQQFFVCV